MSHELAQRESEVIDALELENIKHQLTSLLGDDKRKTQAFKTRILKISFNTMLEKCSPVSIIQCGIQALTLNLSLESGQGYIVNYGGKASFDCGYKGWQLLAKRSGFSVLADVVYSCDEFNQEGFGFDREMVFSPNYAQRNGANDDWAKDNLVGVIVSIKEDEAQEKSHAFVPADMIKKIAGKSSSMQTDRGKKFSPHENWAEQMFLAKAIKQVITKLPIDLSEASQLSQAIEIVNNSESIAQGNATPTPLNSYPQDRLNENFPKWAEMVANGKKAAMAIISQLSNSYSLTPDQLEKVFELKQYQPIDGQSEIIQEAS